MAMPVPTAHTMMPKRRLDEVSTEQGLKMCLASLFTFSSASALYANKVVDL